jgi:DNA-binding response OmpR family regulator
MNPHLLIVEDDAGLRQMLTWELEDLGYEITAVEDCGAALEKTAGQSFDAALLDYCLPDGNGVDLLAALRMLAPDMPVIMYSALACSDTRERARGLGAVSFLTKPASVQAVDQAFRQAISRKAA